MKKVIDETNNVVNIISQRDDLTINEAISLVKDVALLIEENPENAIDIMLEELGLEMEYIFDIV